jgi:Family of unknown function (DUF5856)
MISLNEYNSSNDFGGVIGKLFEARDYAHYVHLHNSSYAKHKALGSFYGKIIDLADSLYETHTGQYGHVNFSVSMSKEKNEIEYFEDLAKIMKDSHKIFEDKDTHLHNILDEIVGEIYSLLYKLKYLK